MITGKLSTRKVYAGGVPIDPAPSLELRNHSPDGFAWGYGGSGPAQLALALLLHYTNEQFALEHYQQFKFDVIAAQPMEMNLQLRQKTVRDWLKKHGWPA